MLIEYNKEKVLLNLLTTMNKVQLLDKIDEKVE